MIGCESMALHGIGNMSFVNMVGWVIEMYSRHRRIPTLTLCPFRASMAGPFIHVVRAAVVVAAVVVMVAVMRCEI